MVLQDVIQLILVVLFSYQQAITLRILFYGTLDSHLMIFYISLVLIMIIYREETIAIHFKIKAICGLSEEVKINISKPHKLHFMALTYEQIIAIKCTNKFPHFIIYANS